MLALNNMDGVEKKRYNGRNQGQSTGTSKPFVGQEQLLVSLCNRTAEGMKRVAQKLCVTDLPGRSFSCFVMIFT